MSMKITLIPLSVSSLICPNYRVGCYQRHARPTYTLVSQRKAGQTDRVTVLMEVGGEFKEGAEGKASALE